VIHPLLHVGALVTCPHGGVLVPMTASGRVRVNGHLVLTARQAHAVHGCPHVRPDGTPSPCSVAAWSGGSTRVRSHGRALLLAASTATCTPNATTATVHGVQHRVRAA
jgi:hypothetical protein